MEKYSPKPNQIRHAENLSLLHNTFYKGEYYRNGQKEIPKEKRSEKIQERRFNVFDYAKWYEAQWNGQDSD